MKKIFMLTCIFFYSNCLPQSVISENQELQPVGLQDKVITSLTVEQTDFDKITQLSDNIFAGTENGVFGTSLIADSSNWISIGLENRSVTALNIQHWGVGPVDGLTLFAAVIPDYEQGDSTFIFRREVYLAADTNWIASDSGISKSINGIYALNSYYFSGHEPPQPILAGGYNDLYQANWSGYFWTQSEIEDVDLQPVIKAIDVNVHWGGNLTWAAGYIGLSPAAFRSTDQGETWKVFPLIAFQDYAPASSIAINTRNPDSVYICWLNSLLLTPDNGESWEGVLSTRAGGIGRVAVDPLHPENVFAGTWFVDDSHQSPDHAEFLHSKNGGKDWEHINLVTNVPLEYITSIVVLNRLEENNTYVFVGTAGTGVWYYKYPIVTDVAINKNIPEKFILYQNFPNPFNPSTKIKFEIPPAPSRKLSFVNLKVYDVLGREIATLVDEEKPEGEYEVEFDANNLTSGIYFYAIKAGNFNQVKKMILLR